MTRDQWVRAYARHLIEQAGLDHGEAAACAAEAAHHQQSVNGRSPQRWDSPKDSAAAEVASWSEP